MRGVLGIDVGGSGMKAALVDVESGALLSDRHRVETPHPATPDTMSTAIRQLVGEFDYKGTVGCCFPTVVIDGHAKSVSNLDEAWRDVQIDSTFERATGQPFFVINDADAAAVAEMQLGAGRGLDGMVLTITIGTGIGSGMYFNGQLIPNLELGPIRSRPCMYTRTSTGLPIVDEFDEAQRFPLEVMKKAGELGFLGILFPE